MRRGRGNTCTAHRLARGLLAAAALAGLLAFAGSAAAKPKPYAAPSGSLYYQLPPALRHWLGPRDGPGIAPGAPRLPVAARGRARGRPHGSRPRGARPVPQAHALARLREQPGVRFAEPDYRRPHRRPAGAERPALHRSVGPRQVHARAGWQIFPGAFGLPPATPTIAILDTGIDSTDADLARQRPPTQAPNCINVLAPALAAALDRPDRPRHARRGHRRRAGENGEGVAGVAFASPLIPVKVLRGTRAAPSRRSRAGSAGPRPRRAGDQPQPLDDRLLGRRSATRSPPPWQGALVVAAAGNAAGFGAGTRRSRPYPAACPGAVGVGAVAPTSPPPAPGSGHEWPYGASRLVELRLPVGLRVGARRRRLRTRCRRDLVDLPRRARRPVRGRCAAPPPRRRSSPGSPRCCSGQAQTRTACRRAAGCSRRPPRRSAVTSRTPTATARTARRTGACPGLADPFTACSGLPVAHPFHGYGRADLQGASSRSRSRPLISVAPASAPIKRDAPDAPPART